MTLYAGETVRIESTMTGFDEEPLVGDDVTSVTVEIWDAAGVVVQVVTPMSWSPEQLGWLYLWQTGLNPAGGYRARVLATGPAETVSWEYKTFRLAKNPEVAAV